MTHSLPLEAYVGQRCRVVQEPAWTDDSYSARVVGRVVLVTGVAGAGTLRARLVNDDDAERAGDAALNDYMARGHSFRPRRLELVSDDDNTRLHL